MNKIFRVSDGFKVPDGTWVHSILDSNSCSRDSSPFIDNLSIAAGTIPPHTESKIHIHPVITQVTWVIDGKLSVKMRDSKNEGPYVLNLHEEEAAVTKPMTFFQLINTSEVDCRVLYISSPAFLFSHSDDGRVDFNDAIVLDKTWEELGKSNWLSPGLPDMAFFAKNRQKLIDRLKNNHTS